MQNGKSAIVAQTSDDTRFCNEVDKQIDFSTDSLLAVPLWVRNTVVGVLEVVNKQNGGFATDDCVLAETLAASAAVAIDNARMMDMLRQQTEELKARNEDLDAFAHSVAHDLQNPLSLIVGFSGLLRASYEELSSEEISDRLSVISASGYRASAICDAFLLLAGARLPYEFEAHKLNMAEIVANVRDHLAGMTDAYQAEIVQPASWPQAMGYSPWIEQVWINYLSNALKYGGRPPRIELGASISESSGQVTTDVSQPQVRFWVRDNGCGISPKSQHKLFTPFTRLDQANANGHGLGLAIVRHIVERLNGRVGVDSNNGQTQGAIFWFTLPAADPARG